MLLPSYQHFALFYIRLVYFICETMFRLLFFRLGKQYIFCLFHHSPSFYDSSFVRMRVPKTDRGVMIVFFVLFHAAAFKAMM